MFYNIGRKKNNNTNFNYLIMSNLIQKLNHQIDSQNKEDEIRVDYSNYLQYCKDGCADEIPCSFEVFAGDY